MDCLNCLITHGWHLYAPAQAFQADYDKQDDREKERYEKKLMRYLEDLIREMDRKIAKAKDRADKESMPKPVKPEDQARLDELQARIKGACMHHPHMLPWGNFSPILLRHGCCHQPIAHSDGGRMGRSWQIAGQVVCGRPDVLRG